MLFACIHIPDFPVQAALRADASAQFSFETDLVAVLDGPESLLKVFACNEQARRAGIEPGMTKLQAETCPAVVLLKRIAEQEESAQAALLDCARDFSPRVESTCPGTVIVDLTGAGRLFGLPKDAGQQLAARAVACGFTVNVGLGANPDVSLHAARGFAGVMVIAEGEEAQRLAALPVEVLQPSPEMLDTLDSWGIRTFKALAALPSIPLTQRLGQPGLHLQRLARGEVRRELVLAEAATLFLESLELEEAVDLLEPLGFVLNRLLGDLITRLQARSLATDHVQVSLELEIHPDRQVRAEPPTDMENSPTLCSAMDGTPGSLHAGLPPQQAKSGLPPQHAKTVRAGDPGLAGAPGLGWYQRALKLPVPTQDSKILLKLLELDLAAHPPPAPVKKITVEVFPARVRLTQAGLFQPLAPEPAKLEITLSRLRAAVGEQEEVAQAPVPASVCRGRVGFPLVMDSHRSDSFQVLPSSAEEAGNSSQRKTRGDREKIGECLPAPQLVLRWFRPPLAARVECRPAAGGEAVPAAVIFNGVRAKIIHACGPWRSSGSWWDHSGQWQREEWDVALGFSNVDGACGLYRIFRDAQSGQWFVEGMYD
jgi:protein ImuB